MTDLSMASWTRFSVTLNQDDLIDIDLIPLWPMFVRDLAMDCRLHTRRRWNRNRHCRLFDWTTIRCRRSGKDFRFRCLRSTGAMIDRVNRWTKTFIALWLRHEQVLLERWREMSDADEENMKFSYLTKYLADRDEVSCVWWWWWSVSLNGRLNCLIELNTSLFSLLSLSLYFLMSMFSLSLLSFFRKLIMQSNERCLSNGKYHVSKC